MKIACDKKGKEAILQLCNIALKTGGLQNMQGVSEVLNSIKVIEENEEQAIDNKGEKI